MAAYITKKDLDKFKDNVFEILNKVYEPKNKWQLTTNKITADYISTLYYSEQTKVLTAIKKDIEENYSRNLHTVL